MTSVEISTAALAAADKLIQLALAEDLEDRGDLTSQATVPPKSTAEVNLVARENGVLSSSIPLTLFTSRCVCRMEKE